MGMLVLCSCSPKHDTSLKDAYRCRQSIICPIFQLKEIAVYEKQPLWCQDVFPDVCHVPIDLCAGTTEAMAS